MTRIDVSQGCHIEEKVCVRKAARRGWPLGDARSCQFSQASAGRHYLQMIKGRAGEGAQMEGELAPSSLSSEVRD